MKRHFKIQTAAGMEDIYCDDFDDTRETEYWFIFANLPPRIFQKSHVISLQEIPQSNPDQWRRIAQKFQPPEDTYETEE